MITVVTFNNEQRKSKTDDKLVKLSGYIKKAQVYKVGKLHHLVKNIIINPEQSFLAEEGQREGGQIVKGKQHYRLRLNQIW